jgi:hypothetical protein
MRNLAGWAIGLFCASWIANAAIDFKDDKDTLRVYRIKEVLDRTSSYSGNTLPKYSTEAVREFKVSGQKVISRVGSFIDEYDNCQVFDVENWRCAHADESATFGATDGVYYSVSNVAKFPQLADPLFRDGINVSRLRVVLTNCSWYFTASWFEGVLGCALAPFITE